MREILALIVLIVAEVTSIQGVAEPIKHPDCRVIHVIEPLHLVLHREIFSECIQGQERQELRFCRDMRKHLLAGVQDTTT